MHVDTNIYYGTSGILKAATTTELWILFSLLHASSKYHNNSL